MPRQNYARAHLAEICLRTGISDWFEFLNRENRLVLLMDIAKPPTRGNLINGVASRTAFSWNHLGLLKWYGIWGAASPQEEWLFTQIAKRCEDWHEVNGWLEPTSERAIAVIAVYKRLLSLAKGLKI